MAKEFPFGRAPFDISSVDFLSRPRYGELPERELKFWEYMIRQRRTASWARQQFGIGGGSAGSESAQRERPDGPVWCFTRLGRSVTQLRDGSLVYIGGEHEDFYDSDFCIYNDVVVEDTSGNITIRGYAKDVFPPTDFHTATLVGDEIWVIGSLGYQDLRRAGETQVMRFGIDDHRIKSVATSGDNPGWISGHTATFERRSREISVTGGKVWVSTEGETKLIPNIDTFILLLDTLAWRRLDRS
ncbi:MAG: hypothetical protein ABL904_11205 [Hyphomicrobiaceae bacterium]